MKIYTRVFGTFLSCMALCSASATAHDPRVTRSTLFKYSSLINKDHTALHNSILRRIFLAAGALKDVRLALCSIKCASSASKDNREMFIKQVIAMVNCINKIILEHRKFVKFVASKQTSLTATEKRRFDMICAFYKTRDLNELLMRVAPLPVSLAVAQAALESGFGSCKYLNERNGIFGMMETKSRLMEFDTAFEATIAYAKTLNVHRSYRDFRAVRKISMAQNKKIDGVILSGYIKRYSVNPKYQKDILSIIKQYDLQTFDRVYS